MNFSDLCIRRPVFASMLIAVLVVVGWVSYRRLGVDLFPHVEIPTVTITATLPGAGPEEIETRVTKPIEEAVNTIHGVDILRSRTVEGMSQVLVVFEMERDLDAAAQDVRDKVGAILAQLPEGTDPPVVDKFDVDSTPVMLLTVTGSRDLKDLTEITRQRVKEPLESVLGVGAIRLIGGREREIQVELDATRMAAYGFTVPAVAAALAMQNVEVPGGRLVAGPQETAVRTLGRVERVADLGEVQIANRPGGPIRVRDVATVRDGAVEPRSLSRYNGVNAVTLAIRKQSGTNAVEVADAIRARLPGLIAGLPAGIQVEITRDWSTFIRHSAAEVERHMLFGALLASVVVLLFMRNWRATIIAALAIPTSIVATFTAMYVAGFSINQVTLLALTLAVGIVIDDAIVVLENIWRYVEEKGVAPFEAARQATAEVGLAVSATTLSLVVVFVPVAFVAGVIGQFLRSFGLTMAFAIVVSLLVAFSLAPMLSARLLRRGGSSHSKESRFYAPIDRAYAAMVEWSLRRRWTVLALAAGLVALTPALARLAGSAFIPQEDRGEFEINLQLPQGVSLASADATLREIEASLGEDPAIRGLLATVGGASGDDVTRAQVVVLLRDLKEREDTQFEVMQRVRDRLRPLRSRLRMSVDNPPPISGTGYGETELMIHVRGPEQAELDRAAARLRQIMEDTPGAVDVDTSAVAGRPEVQLVVHRDKAADLGVRMADIAQTVRVLVAGSVVTQFKEAGELYDVRLRLRPEDRARADSLGALLVPSARGDGVRLDSIAAFRPGTGPAQIDRQGRQRQLTLYGNVAPGHAFGDILAAVMKRAGDLDLPSGYTVDVGGLGRLYEETVVGFQIAVTLSIVFMYMVLAAQFESLLHPITIMLCLPLAVPFAFFSLWIAGDTVNMFSGLGILLLFGIVKKNSILQVDHTLALRRAGVPRDEAILRANRDRLRPILMTTLSLVVAMVPAALARGHGAEVSRAIAIVVVGGQSLCLLITLLVTPVAYSLFDDAGEALRRLRARWRAGASSAEPTAAREA